MAGMIHDYLHQVGTALPLSMGFVGLMLFLFLMLSRLFQYPEVSGTPTMLAIDSLLCCGIVGLYRWIGIRDTRLTATMEVSGPWLGMKASVIFGILLIGTSLVSTLLISILWERRRAQWDRRGLDNGSRR